MRTLSRLRSESIIIGMLLMNMVVSPVHGSSGGIGDIQQESSRQPGPPPRVYTAGGGATDPQEVRRTVTTLGTGKRVELTVRDAKKVRVTIRAVQDDFFSVRQGNADRDVRYADVVQLKPASLNPWVKGPITAGSVVCGLMVLAVVVCYTNGACDN